MLNCCAACFFPCSDSFFASSGFFSRSVIAFASACSSRGGTSMPLSSKNSGTLPTELAIIGTPDAIASAHASPNVSMQTLGKTRMLAFECHVFIVCQSCLPRNRVLLIVLSVVSICSINLLYGSSCDCSLPIKTSFASGIFSTTCLRDFAATHAPLNSMSEPTNSMIFSVGLCSCAGLKNL